MKEIGFQKEWGKLDRSAPVRNSSGVPFHFTTIRIDHGSRHYFDSVGQMFRVVLKVRPERVLGVARLMRAQSITASGITEGLAKQDAAMSRDELLRFFQKMYGDSWKGDDTQMVLLFFKWT